ncbi:glycosyltransferase [Proteus terrae]|uniref:glycosyltransferase n=1 Tax=Proteus terrae TaxID=1574161 RepID=UPI0038AE95AA
MNVAVIMSVYFSDNNLEVKEAINSILNQSYSCDLFLFKDGDISSSLNSLIEEYSTLDNVYLINSDKNVGLAKGLNTLIDKVVEEKRYEFVARMDSDDLSRVNRIESQVKYLTEHSEIDVLGTGCREFGSNYALEKKILPTKHEELLDLSITRCPFIHPTVMFRVRVFESGYRYPTDTRFTEDMALWFVLLDAGYILANLDDVLLDYRLNEGTLKRRKGIDKAMSEFRLRYKYMIRLKKFTLRNFMKNLARFVFHLLPVNVLLILYKHFR